MATWMELHRRMINELRATEGRLKCIHCMYSRVDGTTGPCTCDHEPTDILAHEYRVTQWMTDDYIAIIRHETKKKGLSSTKGQERKCLNLTA